MFYADESITGSFPLLPTLVIVDRMRIRGGANTRKPLQCIDKKREFLRLKAQSFFRLTDRTVGAEDIQSRQQRGRRKATYGGSVALFPFGPCRYTFRANTRVSTDIQVFLFLYFRFNWLLNNPKTRYVAAMVVRWRRRRAGQNKKRSYPFVGTHRAVTATTSTPIKTEPFRHKEPTIESVKMATRVHGDR